MLRKIRRERTTALSTAEKRSVSPRPEFRQTSYVWQAAEGMPSQSAALTAPPEGELDLSLWERWHGARRDGEGKDGGLDDIERMC